MIDIMPAILETFTLTFVVSYMFGMVGNIIFGHAISDWDSPTNAMIKAQQLTYMVLFTACLIPGLMRYGTGGLLGVHGGGDGRAAAVGGVHLLHLLSDHLAGRVQHRSLHHHRPARHGPFLAIPSPHIQYNKMASCLQVLDDQSSKDREGQRGKLQIVFDKIIAQARTRQIFNSTNTGVLNFHNVRMAHFQSTNVRQFVAGGKHVGLQLEVSPSSTSVSLPLTPS